MTPIETRHLRHFVAVAETGNFQKAAREVHLSQPAVTKSIQRMEHWFGYKLFDRGTKLELTDFGRLLLAQARKTLIHFDDLQHEANLFRNLAIGELTVGAGPLMAESIVGPAVGRLLERQPNLHITVQVDNFAQFPERLRHRELDLFIADVTQIKGESEFEIMAVPAQEGVWFCRPGHPLAGRRSVTLDDFFRYPIVLPMLTTWLAAWFAENYPAGRREKSGPFRPALSCSHFSTLKAVVQNSDAICGAAPTALASDFRQKRFVRVPLNAPRLYTNPGIVSLKGRSLSPAALALIGEIQEEMMNSTSAGAGSRALSPRTKANSPRPMFAEVVLSRVEKSRRPKARALR